MSKRDSARGIPSSSMMKNRACLDFSCDGSLSIVTVEVSELGQRQITDRCAKHASCAEITQLEIDRPRGFSRQAARCDETRIIGDFPAELGGRFPGLNHECGINIPDPRSD